MSLASEPRDDSPRRRWCSRLSISLLSLMGFPSAPSRACSAPVLGPRPGSLQPFRGPPELLLASPLLQGPMVSKATWREAPSRGDRGASLGGRSGGLTLWPRQKVAFSCAPPTPPTVVLEVGRDAGVERHFHICVWLYPGHFLRLAAPGDFHL